MEEAEVLKRVAIGRETIVGKLLTAIILSGFILYVIPSVKPTLFSTVVIVLSVGIIADTMARYLTGKSEWHILIPSALVVIADILLFTVFRVGV